MNCKLCIVSAVLVSWWAIACHNNQMNRHIAKENTAMNEEDSARMANIRSNENNAQMVAEMALSGYLEIEMAKAAKKKSYNKEIKKIAALLQSDDMVLMKQLKQVAANRNIHVPDSATKSDMQKITKMKENNTPATFDKKWCADVLDENETLIAEMEDAATTVTDPALRAWVNDALPKIRVHRDKLMQLKYKLK
jgi:predicted outer membrane protein